MQCQWQLNSGGTERLCVLMITWWLVADTTRPAAPTSVLQVSSDDAVAMARRLALEEGLLTGEGSLMEWLAC